VGLRGIRIQNIVNELNGERIDVVQWDEEPSRFVANALSPAQVLTVQISVENNTASVIVPDRQLSLAIGREGQNARLAAKLTGWRIDIKPESTMQEVLAAAPATTRPAATPSTPTPPTPAPDPETQPWMEVIDEEKAAAEAPAAEVQAETAAEAPPQPEAKAAGPEPLIRFAEDVLVRSNDESKKRKKTKKAKKAGGKTEGKADAPQTKVKKAKRARRPVVEEEDEFEDVDV
jgi:N utilization substance protein A